MVHRTAASQLRRHRFLTRPITLSVAKYNMRSDFAPGSSRSIAFQLPTESQPWASCSTHRTTSFHIPSYFGSLQSNHCNTPSAQSTSRCSTIHIARTIHSWHTPRTRIVVVVVAVVVDVVFTLTCIIKSVVTEQAPVLG